jgi:hypothetical protein
MVSPFDRVGSPARGLRRKPGSQRARREQDRRLRLAIDQLENRVALAITTPLSIGGVSTGSFTDSPTGIGSLGDFVTVTLQGTRGTVSFIDSNGNAGVADGTDIRSILITNASPDFQLTVSAVVQTANPVPYGSDGIVQLGKISTTNVIRGINTVRGPATNVAITTSPPIGFNQAAPGSSFTVEGDQTATWTNASFVSLTPLAPSSPVGGTVFGKVNGAPSFDGNTNLTTVTIDNSTPAGTTAGAVTLASTVQPYFVLTSFTGVNFSNANQKGGGLFVDKVVGADTTVDGTAIPDLGILLSQGLLAYSTIGIRDELDATVVLGTKAKASTDGRMLVGTATSKSVLYIGPRTRPTAANSKFQLDSARAFNAGVVVSQAFNGVMNIAGDTGGSWIFERGVGSNAVLNAGSWDGQTAAAPFNNQRGVRVVGDFAGTINGVRGPGDSDIILAATGNLAATARVNAENEVSLTVGRSILKGAVIASGRDTDLDVTGNVAAVITAGDDIRGDIDGSLIDSTLTPESDISLLIGRDIVNSVLTASSNMDIDVLGSIRNSRFVTGDADIDIYVKGDVVNSSFTNTGEYGVDLEVDGSMSGSTVQTFESDISVDVAGNVTSSTFASSYSDVSVTVGGDFLNSKVVTGERASLSVGRDALSSSVVADDEVSLSIGRNWSGTAQSASEVLEVAVGGSVLKGSSFASGGDTSIRVSRNFDGTTTSRALNFVVGGTVSQASRITAQAVRDWQSIGAGALLFSVLGRFDGIVNVGSFDASPVSGGNAEVLGGGAGNSARFNVDRFENDTLRFRGNFLGNLRVNQDLVANLDFSGNVHRITIGGRVGSYTTGNTIERIPVSINVAGRLLFLNSNSFFQPAQVGKNGNFWNDATSTSPDPLAVTGLLSTGSYVTVVPIRPAQQTPAPISPQTYAKPTAPTGFLPQLTGTAPGPYGINVDFSAPTTPGGLPIVFYEFSTDNGTTWRRFTNPNQGPATGIALPGPSGGGTGFSPGAYTVLVRAQNALGWTATASQPINVPV